MLLAKEHYVNEFTTDQVSEELRHGQRILKKLASFFKFVDCDRS